MTSSDARLGVVAATFALAFVGTLPACSGPVTAQDYRALCERYEECPGNDFDDNYDSIEDCADDYLDTIEDRSGPCRAVSQDAVLCQISNFQCDGRPDACDEIYDTLDDECDDDDLR
jgi:hypothetical protein